MNTISVTQIINNFKKFDREFWLSYKALEQLMPPEAFEACKMKMLKSKKVDSAILSQVDLEEFELKRLEIDAEWRKENEEAKQQGTAIHDLIRTQLIGGNSIKSDFNVIGNLATDEFLNAKEGLFVENKLELPVEEFVIIGIPDLVKIENGVVHCWDWKTSKKGIRFKSNYDLAAKKNRKLKFPLHGIDDVNGQHYTLQLSLYMWMILQLRPDLKPGTLNISWVQDMRVKKSFEVPYMEAEVNQLIQWYIKDMRLKQEMDKCKEIQY
jgi:hypothetical protein